MVSKVEGIFTQGREACEKAVDRIYSTEQSPISGVAIQLYLRNFQSFNATFGFRKGEHLLRQVAEYLCELWDGPIYRHGGGVSFIMLLDGMDKSAALELARRIAARLEHPWHIDGLDCICTGAVGVVSYPEYADTPEDLFHNLRLITVKREAGWPGQSPVTVFDHDWQERFYRDSITIRLLATAVELEQIDLRYRPIYDCNQQRYGSVECSPRLLTVEYGAIRQEEFLPLAEESGVICFVNMHILKMTIQQLGQMIKNGLPIDSLSLLISPVLLAQHRFFEDLAELLEKYQVPPSMLAIELHEHPMSTGHTLSAAKSLKEVGVKVILGGVDLSLSGLKGVLSLPIDAIKLGRKAVWQLETNRRAGIIAAGISQIAAGLGVELIAEGVENEKQDSMLNQLGCRFRQGVYYSRSLPLERFEEIVRG